MSAALASDAASGRERAGPGAAALLYALFALSGFAGLIYESIWAHYLKLFLGHAAYAQTLVLVIFMGGMATGAWIAGEVSRRLARPLLAYVVAEALLGVAALVFDGLFQAMQQWVFDALVPALAALPWAVDLAKWSLAALIILPQSILLGATFPLISAGLVRWQPAQPGRALGWLYFSNSLGAAVGVLASGFWLIGMVGLPGTMLTAGLINFALALGVYLLLRSSEARWRGVGEPMRLAAGATADRILLRRVLLAAALTGAASFLYEIGWIRMLALLLGSTSHSFELMLSAFIFGLAAGSFWIRRRIDGAVDPLRLLGAIQVAMALLALGSLPLYMGAFPLMAGFFESVRGNFGGYLLFNLFAHAICFALMLPATFCAGMTLPLMTAILLRAGHGEAAIGRVYACNTVGAIAGTLLAVHLLMPGLGLRNVVVAGALLDLGLGLWLLRLARPLGPARGGALAAALAACAAIIVFVRFDPAVVASGVYRNGQARAEGELLYHRDGKTATVDVVREADGNVWIATNGKVDAGMRPAGEPTADVYTTTLLALLPLALHEPARSAAVIGMGSGSTSATLLANPRLERVDTIEIEPAMRDGARHFGPISEAAFGDPRSRIVIEDAKTHFARAGLRYDLILSEPSNPWVSGIASLFSEEFYAQVQRYLAPQGLFVQWVQLYEIDADMLATIFGALASQFRDYVVYVPNGDDLLIVATHDRRVPPPTAWLFGEPAMAATLERLGVRTLADLQVRRLAGAATLQPLMQSLAMPANSDYFPVLDQLAAQRRFMLASARDLLRLQPYSQRLERDPALSAPELAWPAYLQPVPGAALQARALARMLRGERVELPAGLFPREVQQLVPALALVESDCRPAVLDTLWLDAMRSFTASFAAYLPPDAARAIVDRLQQGRCARRLGAPARAWLELLDGIARQQPDVVAARAAALLALTRVTEEAQFLLAEWVLAELQRDRPEQARAALDGPGGEVPRDLTLRYLEANVALRMMLR